MRATDDTNLARYREAEAALANVLTRIEAGEPGQLTGDERAALERIVVQLDAQLAAVSMHRWIDACMRVDRVTRSGGRSPISDESI